MYCIQILPGRCKVHVYIIFIFAFDKENANLQSLLLAKRLCKQRVSNILSNEQIYHVYEGYVGTTKSVFNLYRYRFE